MTGRRPPEIAVVFGGTGFLGHAIVQALAEGGYHVRVPTRDPEKAKDLRPMGSVGQIEPVWMSLRSDVAIAQVVKDADIVINLLGELAEDKKNSFQYLHVETAARLARLAKTAGVKRFIHVSAMGADAHSPSKYARTKAIGEDAVRAFFPGALILRPNLIFGPRDRFFNRFALMARFSPFLPLIGGGLTRFQPIFAGDVAAFLMLCLKEPEWTGLTFSLAGPKTYTLKELFSILLRTLGLERRFWPLSWRQAKLLAALFEFLPAPPLTRDQVDLLKEDVVLADGEANDLETLGMKPTPLEAVLPRYLA